MKNKLILLLVIFVSGLFSQPDSARIHALLKSAKNKYSNLPIEGLDESLEALSLSENSDYSKGVIDACIQIANCNEMLSNLSIAETYLKKGLTAAIDIKDKQRSALCYSNLGNLYFRNANSTKSIEFQLKALDLYKEVNDQKGLSGAFQRLGNALTLKKDFNSAIIYFRKSLEIKTKLNDSLGMAKSLSNIGLAYEKLNIIDSANHFLEAALKIKLKLNDYNSTASSYIALASLFIKQKKYLEAENSIDKAVFYASTTENFSLKKEILSNKIEIYKLLNKKEALVDLYAYSETLNDSINAISERKSKVNNDALFAKQAHNNLVRIELENELLMANKTTKKYFNFLLIVSVLSGIIVCWLIVLLNKKSNSKN